MILWNIHREDTKMNKFMKKMAALLMTALVLCLMTTAVFAADTDKSEKE